MANVDSLPPVGAPSPGADRPSRLELVDTIAPRPWWKRILLFFAFCFLALLLATSAVGLGLYAHFSQGLPEVPRVDEYRPPILTEFRSDDGDLVGEFYRERRKVVPYEQIPKKLVQAFIAAEDKNFFDHPGIDLVGTARAASVTLRGGHKIQGGSTLTQQTAKAILISTEGYKKSTVRKGKEGLVRKIREAILSRRLEKALTKEEILYLYLNNVYLGHHAYGVQAAAENYFRKDARDLSLAEMATLAGLPQSPSQNPFAHPKRAQDRRGYVLGRMLVDGMISQAEFAQADKETVKAFDVEDVFHETSPFYAEQVRRDIVDRYSNERLLTQGLTVDLTMNAERQRAAQNAMLNGLISVDKRQGYYGPLFHLDADAERKAFGAKIEKLLTRDEPMQDGYYPALVTGVDDKEHVADLLIGSKHKGKLPLAGMLWARRPNPEAYFPGVLISKVKSALKEGDVVLVRQRTAEQLRAEVNALTDKRGFGEVLKGLPTDAPLYDLEQEPQLQGAIISIDPQKNYVPAMIGGYDFDASEFNRAIQACRQPGSAFKPVEYSAAIEQLDYTASTVIVDSPIVYDDPDNQLRWKPENYENDFKGEVIVRTALMESMNIPAIKTFIAVGIPKVQAWAKNLGLTTEVHSDFSSALGSSCVHPWELAQVYAVFDRDGRKEPIHLLRQVRDRFGRVLEDHTAPDDPWASSSDRIRAAYAQLFDKPEQVMEPETAFLTTELLHDVATGGTGAAASRLGKPVAGKTGTTNDSHDTWFVGYTHDVVTSVWLGYDDYRHDPMGKYEAGSRAALPIWLEYMRHALDGVPQPAFQPAAGADIVYARIDPKTGKRAKANQANAVTEAYKRGNEPTETEGEVSPGEALNPMMTP
jgi:penicillin-binding protein 1A